MWQAFEADEPTVLLIDAIDKADIEFSNDFRRAIDRNEKELPDAFLRRCFFHYITVPDANTMQSIVDVHHPSKTFWMLLSSPYLQ